MATSSRPAGKRARGDYFFMVKSQLAGDAGSNTSSENSGSSDAVPAAAAAALPSTPPVGNTNAPFLDLDAAAAGREAPPHPSRGGLEPSRGGLVQIGGSGFGEADALGSPTLRRLPSEGHHPISKTLDPRP